MSNIQYCDSIQPKHLSCPPHWLIASRNHIHRHQRWKSVLTFDHFDENLHIIFCKKKKKKIAANDTEYMCHFWSVILPCTVNGLSLYVFQQNFKPHGFFLLLLCHRQFVIVVVIAFFFFFFPLYFFGDLILWV